jgi:hypothetical protein
MLENDSLKIKNVVHVTNRDCFKWNFLRVGQDIRHNFEQSSVKIKLLHQRCQKPLHILTINQV